MISFRFIFLAFLLIFFITTSTYGAYFSPDLKDAINYECKKLVKERKFPNKKICKKSLKISLEKIGVVSVKKVPNIEDQLTIERYCVSKIKFGALLYNKCIYKYVNQFLGIDTVEPPVLVVNNKKEEKDDPELPPENIPMPKNVQLAVYEKVIPSTFFVQTWIKDENDDWANGGTGTAVVIASDTLATNCHVIADKDNTFLTTDIIHVNDNVKDIEKWHRDLELLISDFESDRCIITTKEPLNAPSVNTRNYKDLKTFEKVYAIGNPRGYVGKPSKGQITRLYDYIPPGIIGYFGNANIPLIETNVPIDKGNSGGGLFDTSGNLIGITSICKTLGGAEVCPIEEEGPCYNYCNDSDPQNWSIPIHKYLELF